jgi:hypothetical protein
VLRGRLASSNEDHEISSAWLSRLNDIIPALFMLVVGEEFVIRAGQNQPGNFT